VSVHVLVCLLTDTTTVWLSLWGSKIVSHFLPFVFQFVAGVVSSGTRKYALIIKALEIPLSLAGWAITSLATFIPLMLRNPYARAHNQKQSEWMTIMNQILAACLIGTLVLLVEKFFIQLISINYHRKQFNARIKESKRNVFLLGLLYDASRTLFPAYEVFAEEDYMIADQLNLSLLGKKGAGHKRSGSVTPFRLLQNVGRFGDQVTSAFGNVAQEITGKQVFNPNSAHSIVIGALEKRRTSEALARRLWMSFVMEGKEALYEEDLIEVLGDNRREEAEEAFIMLDKDCNGDIGLDEAVQQITQISRDRKALGTSMHDVDQAINVLDRLLMVIVSIIVVFTFIAFLNKNFTTTLATAGTTLLSLSFVFSVTAQEVLGSCIFLFVKHPYDIGDRVDIGADHFAVDHISLLFTVFRRISGLEVGKSVQIPNNVLNALWIENVSRSKAMKEQLTLDVHFDTTFEDIQLLKNELIAFVCDKDNSRDFLPEIDVEVLGTSDMSKLQLRVEVRHKGNFANETQRASRRSKFMCALVQSLRRVPIYGPGGGSDALGGPANPTYSVSVSDGYATEAREASANTKDKARLVPNKKVDDAMSPSQTRSKHTGTGPLGLSAKETAIVDTLHSQAPGLDSTREEPWMENDSSTLDERTSNERAQNIEEVRGLLRRETTKGKRRPSNHPMSQQTVPTISEPAPQMPYSGYAQAGEASLDVDDYEQYRTQAQGGQGLNLSIPNSGPALPTSPSAYVQGSSYVDASRTTSGRQQSGQNVEMNRNPSNPYRQQSVRKNPYDSD
jgi:small-conductance mechanosensitive channel